MRSFLDDLRYSARVLRKSPALSLTALSVLALGIGATSAIFSLSNALLFRPLPYLDSASLVAVAETEPQGEPRRVSVANFLDWRSQSRSFVNLAAYELDSFNLSGGREPESVLGAWVSDNFFRALGVESAIGRTFLPGEDAAAAEPVVVLSHHLWQRRFSSDLAIIGRKLSVRGLDNSRPDEVYTIAGVLPPDFWFVSDRLHVFVPSRFSAAQRANRAARSQQAIARLTAGASMNSAAAELAAIASGIAAEHPDTNRNRTAIVVPLQRALFGEPGTASLVLLAAVTFVLLVACANVAGLLLARAASRRHEIAIRIAMGAGRARLLRQLLTESVLLSVLGGLLGLALAFIALDAILALFPPAAQSFLPGGSAALRLDARVLIFTFIVSVFTGILFGLAPALLATRTDVQTVLKQSGAAQGGTPRAALLRGILVVAEFALSVVLVLCAGLMMKGFLDLRHANLGFDAESVLKLEIFAPPGIYSDASRRLTLADGILDRARTLPGVEFACISNSYPLRAPNSILLEIEGRLAPGPGLSHVAGNLLVTPACFRALGIPILQGRDFAATDTAPSLPVAIVNLAFVRLHFASEDPLGRHIRLSGRGSDNRWLTIVGIVPDTMQELSTEPIPPALYRPFAQDPAIVMYLLLRTRRDPSSLTPDVRDAVHSLDPELPVIDVATLRQVVAEESWANRMFAFLFATFGVVALVLAALGIYGLTSHAVALRTREIGIRMALGAHPAQLRRMILLQGLRLVFIGAVIGLAGSLAASQLLSALLFGVASPDAITVSIALLTLGLVALLACFLPARRAAKLDPLVALRYE